MEPKPIALLADMIFEDMPYLKERQSKQVELFFELASSLHLAFFDVKDTAYVETLKREYALYDYHDEDREILSDAWNAAICGIPRSPMAVKNLKHSETLSNIAQFMLGFTVNELGNMFAALRKRGLVMSHRSHDLPLRVASFFLCYHQKDDFVGQRVTDEGCSSLELTLPKALAAVPRYQ